MAIFGTYPIISRRLHVRQSIWLPALVSLFFLCLYLPGATTLVQLATPSATATAATPKLTAQVTPIATTPTPTITTTPAPVTVTRTVVSIPNCTPISFGMPSQLSLANAAAGLTVQADTPMLYQIYGNTAGDLRTQIQHCAPGANGSTSAEFTGQTSYGLTWQYDIVSGDSCSITNIKVGLHTAIALPYWQPTSSANAGLAGRWQSFAADLNTHEQGHATLDKSYAAQLVTNLNSMNSVSCSILNATVSGIVNADVSALNQANDNYDAQTDHGATQGAILPTY